MRNGNVRIPQNRNKRARILLEWLQLLEGFPLRWSISDRADDRTERITQLIGVETPRRRPDDRIGE